MVKVLSWNANCSKELTQWVWDAQTVHIPKKKSGLQLISKALECPACKKISTYLGALGYTR